VHQHALAALSVEDALSRLWIFGVCRLQELLADWFLCAWQQREAQRFSCNKVIGALSVDHATFQRPRGLSRFGNPARQIEGHVTHDHPKQ
jgi:hypothetical protein